MTRGRMFSWWSPVLFPEGPPLDMAAKRRSGRVTKQEVKYFKEESSDEDEEEVDEKEI